MGPTTTQFYGPNWFHRLGRASELLVDPRVLFLFCLYVCMWVCVHLWTVRVYQTWTHNSINIWWEPRCTNTQTETKRKPQSAGSACLSSVEITQSQTCYLHITHKKKKKNLSDNTLSSFFNMLLATMLRWYDGITSMNLRSLSYTQSPCPSTARLSGLDFLLFNVIHFWSYLI